MSQVKKLQMTFHPTFVPYIFYISCNRSLTHDRDVKKNAGRYRFSGNVAFKACKIWNTSSLIVGNFKKKKFEWVMKIIRHSNLLFFLWIGFGKPYPVISGLRKSDSVAQPGSSLWRHVWERKSFFYLKTMVSKIHKTN